MISIQTCLDNESHWLFMTVKKHCHMYSAVVLWRPVTCAVCDNKRDLWKRRSWGQISVPGSIYFSTMTQKPILFFPSPPPQLINSSRMIHTLPVRHTTLWRHHV